MIRHNGLSMINQVQLPDTLEFTVISPSNNKMAQKTLTGVDSVTASSFQLDKYAEQGEWKIEAEATSVNGKLEKTYTFEVEEYVLPTFEVKINTDRSFIIDGDEDDIPLKIDAVYTFGQPVKGDAKVTITKMPCTMPDYYYRPSAPPVPIACAPFSTCPERDENGCLIPPEIILDVKKFTGSYTTVIPRDDLKQVYEFSDDEWRCSCGKNLLITASVIDKNSGEELVTEQKLTVETQKYTVDFIYKPDARREGIPFEFIAQAKYVDGSLLDIDGSVTCLTKQGYGDDAIEHSVTSDLLATDTGYFTCLIDDKFDSYFELTISFNDGSEKQNGQAQSSTYFSNRAPTSDEMVTIKSNVNDRKLVPGETIQIELKSSYDATLTFAAIAKNELVTSQVVTVAADDIVEVAVTIEFEMVPEVKFIAYENRGAHWNADTLTFFVQEDFEHTVNIVPSKLETKVGDNVDLEIQSNAPNSEVFLLGVDKSVKLLAQGNDVTKQKLLEVMQETQTDSWRPWNIWRGCGIWFPWSYGSSAKAKLEDAGYSIVDVKSYEVLGSKFYVIFVGDFNIYWHGFNNRAYI